MTNTKKTPSDAVALKPGDILLTLDGFKRITEVMPFAFFTPAGLYSGGYGTRPITEEETLTLFKNGHRIYQLEGINEITGFWPRPK